MAAPRTLLIDPECNQIFTYEDLLGDLSCDSVPRDNWLLYRQIHEIISRLVFGEFGNLTSTNRTGGNQLRQQALFKSLERAYVEASRGALGPWQTLFRQAAGTLTLTTSGTTGQPRSVQHSAATLFRGIQTGDKHRSDVWALAYPLQSFAGVQVLLQAILNLNPLVIMTELSPTLFHSAIQKHGISHISCTPTRLRMLIDDRYVHPCVQALTSGGEPLDAELLSRLRQVFPNAVIRNVYASTEAGVVMVARGDVFEVLPEMVGKIRIINGELYLHRILLGEFVLETDASQLQDEYYPTADLVEIVAEEPLRLKFTGRRNEMLNVGGHKVNPRHVETVLKRLPEIQDAKVYSRTNSVTGDLVCCDLVETSPGTGIETTLASRVRHSLNPAEVPRIVRIVRQIDFEVTETGKRRR